MSWDSLEKIREPLDWSSVGIGSLAAFGMGLQRVGEIAEDFGGKRLVPLVGLQRIGKYSGLFTAGALTSSLWQTAERLVRLQRDRSSITSAEILDLLTSAFVCVNLVGFALFRQSFAFRLVSTLTGIGIDAAALTQSVLNGSSWKENLLQLSLLVFFNTGREERGYLKPILAFARRSQSIRVVSSERPRTRHLFAQARRKLANERRRLLRREQALGQSPEGRGQRAGLEAQKTQLVHLEMSLDELQGFNLPVHFDLLNEGPVFRVVIGGEVYHHMGRHLLKQLGTGREIRLLPERWSLSIRPEQLARYRQGEVGIYSQGRVFHWDGQRAFLDDFGNRLKIEIREGIFHLHANVEPALPGGFPSDRTLRLTKGFHFPPGNGGCLYYNGLKYQITHSSALRRGRIFQAIAVEDRGRSLVFYKNHHGRISIIQKPVLLKGASCRYDEVLISYRGHTYRAYKADYDAPEERVLFASSLYGSSGLADNWLVVRRGQPLSDRGIATFEPLSESEWRGEYHRRLNAVRELIDGRELPFREIPRPSNIAILGEGATKSWTPSSRLRDPAPLKLRQYQCQLPQTKVEVLLPSGERVWTNQELQESLSLIPLTVLSELRRIVVVPKDRDFCLKGGGEIGGYYDYRNGTLVIQDGYEKKPDRLVAHEMLGHGTERFNLVIEKLIVLAMKLDRKTLSHHATADVQEYYAEGVELRVFHPELSPHIPHLFRLIDRLIQVGPTKIGLRSFDLTAEG